ncbi:MAG: Fis family transcriptional regulator [Methylococcales bacterium]|jgi:Fis family transcriptional regulator|nr:Fis family transcriptional regulator [Methylococcales bacterium]MBT3507076.1 Fis family transcriptional regulator [Methylococcales bacterium]MBT3816613.1 Fis family transcriptional regulator [Methylococcales bacterium]MBT4032364.1 Fis family transcriptional regulator [Methylococcales bacterium]MBT7108826.1 Fis family transcriptional regulator [Methylococcales bacterium]
MTNPSKDSETNNMTQRNATPLATHVRTAVMDYFEHLSDHENDELYTIVIREIEKPMLEVTLEQAGYNQSKAAKILGISRSTLRKKIAQYRIS